MGEQETKKRKRRIKNAVGGGSLQISQRRKMIKQSSRKGAQLVIAKVPIKVKHKHKSARKTIKK